MSKVKDGGPAYPLYPEIPEVKPNHPGMTMRQYYKAAALVMFNSVDWGGMDDEALAKITGQVADAMIAEDAEHEQA